MLLQNPTVIQRSVPKGCKNDSRLGGALRGTVYTMEIPANKCRFLFYHVYIISMYIISLPCHHASVLNHIS